MQNAVFLWFIMWHKVDAVFHKLQICPTDRVLEFSYGMTVGIFVFINRIFKRSCFFPGGSPKYSTYNKYCQWSCTEVKTGSWNETGLLNSSKYRCLWYFLV